MAIQLKRSTTTTNVPGSLATGELALNHADRIMYVRSPAGVVETFLNWITGRAPSGGSAGQMLVKSSGTDYAYAWAGQGWQKMLPGGAEQPTTNFPPYVVVNGRPTLKFNDTTKQTTYFTDVVPPNYAGTLTIDIFFMAASATSNKIDWVVGVEAVTPGDSLDLDATTSFDSDNAISPQGITVPGTAGYLAVATIVLTNADSLAVGDYVRFSISRDAADATNDNATGDAYFLIAKPRQG